MKHAECVGCVFRLLVYAKLSQIGELFGRFELFFVGGVVNQSFVVCDCQFDVIVGFKLDLPLELRLILGVGEVSEVRMLQCLNSS